MSIDLGNRDAGWRFQSNRARGARGIVVVIFALTFLLCDVAGAQGIFGNRFDPQRFAVDQCAAQVNRTTMVIVDTAHLALSSSRALGDIMRDDGAAGYFSDDVLLSGEPFHLVILDTSRGDRSYRYALTGCWVGRTLLSTPAGYDGERLAQRYRVELQQRIGEITQQIRGELSPEPPQNNAPSSRSLDLLRNATTFLRQQGAVTKQIIYVGDPFRTRDNKPFADADTLAGALRGGDLERANLFVHTPGADAKDRTERAAAYTAVLRNGGYLGAYDQIFSPDSLALGLGAGVSRYSIFEGRFALAESPAFERSGALVLYALRRDARYRGADWLQLEAANGELVTIPIPDAEMFCSRDLSCDYRGFTEAHRDFVINDADLKAAVDKLPDILFLRAEFQNKFGYGGGFGKASTKRSDPAQAVFRFVVRDAAAE